MAEAWDVIFSVLNAGEDAPQQQEADATANGTAGGKIVERFNLLLLSFFKLVQLMAAWVIVRQVGALEVDPVIGALREAQAGVCFRNEAAVLLQARQCWRQGRRQVVYLYTGRQNYRLDFKF